MAHKTKIGGTAYEINGGKCLVGGTGYSIKKGRTLVGGTGYDISFGPPAIPVTITGAGDASYCYATINGVTYTSATSGIEVMEGDVITFGVYGTSTTYYGRVTIDGRTALNVTGRVTNTYDWTVPAGTKSISIIMDYTSTSSRRRGRITVNIE